MVRNFGKLLVLGGLCCVACLALTVRAEEGAQDKKEEKKDEKTAEKTEVKSHPYRKAKVGQWIEFKTVSESNGVATVMKSKMTVKAKDNESITIGNLMEMADNKMPEQEQKMLFVDLEKATADAVKPNIEGLKTEELGKGEETLTITGKTLKCNWVKMKTVMQAPMKSETITKTWTSEEVPLGMPVKTESTTNMNLGETEMKTISTSELVGFGG